MLVNLTPKFYLQLADLLEKMGRDADQHYGLEDTEELIETWTPSERPKDEDGFQESINCELTVGDLRMAKRLYQDLRNGREEVVE